MQRAMSTYVYVKQRLHPGLLDGLARAGAQTIEIFGARGHFDYANKAHVREIASWFRASGVPLYSMHSPMFCGYEWGGSGAPPINPVDTDKRRRIEAMDEIKRCLEVAEELPYRFLVQHMGVGGEEFTMQKFEAGLTSLEHLRAFARPLGVNLLIENIPNEMSTPERLLEFIHTLHFEDLGVCFDVGHAHIMSNVPGALAPLKAHIRSTHVHDNARDHDSHLWPGDGSVDWRQTVGMLAAAPHRPPLLMEINGEGKGDILEGMSAAFRRLEVAETAAAQ